MEDAGTVSGSANLSPLALVLISLNDYLLPQSPSFFLAVTVGLTTFIPIRSRGYHPLFSETPGDCLR